MPENITGTENFTSGPIQKPATNESGNDVFSVIETFMERLSNHQHTGAHSKEINVNIDKAREIWILGTPDSGNTPTEKQLAWVSATDSYGSYVATLSHVAGATNTSNHVLFFYIRNSSTASNGTNRWVPWDPPVHPNPSNTSQYYVYCNDNTSEVKVVTF